MTRLAELLAILSDPEQLARLTDDEVGAIHGELAELFASVRAGEVEDVSPHDIEVLSNIGNCLAACAVEAGARYAHAAEAQEKIAEIEIAAGLATAPEVEDADLSALAELTAEELAEVEAYAAALATGEGAEGDPLVPAVGDAEVIPEPVVAASAPRVLPSVREMAARVPQPGVRSPHIVVGDRQGADFTWLPDGRRVTGDELMDLIAGYPGARGSAIPVGQKVVLAQVERVAPNAQRIDSRFDSPDAIARKLDLAVEGSLNPRNWNEDGTPGETLVASGGWGAPAPVVYDLEQLARADRPFTDGLPSVGTDRGGLTFVPPPLYSDVTRGGPSVTTAATGVWTNTTDITPGGTTKSKQTLATANTPRTVQLDAIYMQLQEGVLQSRAYPEWVRTWEQNTRAAWAQEAETRMMDLVEGSPRIKALTSLKLLSATRDFLASVTMLATAERRRQRMAPDAMVRVVAPSYILDLAQIDLVRSGVNFVDSSPMLVARDYLVSQLRAANVNVSFYWDSSTNGAQLMASQSGSGAAIHELPMTVRWYMFHEGMFVHGDGGTLDVGVIRDSTLVNTNDYRIFVESFETIFDRGLWAYYVDQELCPSGAAGGTTDIHTYCDGS